MNYKQIAERVLWTFFQGAVGSVVAVNLATATTPVNVSQLKVYALGMLGGGIAAVVSYLKNLSINVSEPVARSTRARAR